MNITIQVDEITLDTVVAEVVDFDEDGDAVETGQTTVADMVAKQIVERLVKSDRYPGLRDQVTQIRNEEIRAAVRPAINEAITRPIRKTNHYGEVTGGETTLSELIVEEARKQLKENVDRYDSKKGTVLSQTIAAEVRKAFGTEIAAAVQQARDLVITQLGDEIGQQITATVTAALAKR